MKRLKYIIFLIIVTPVVLFAQDSLVTEIFRLFPNCTNFDTRIYLAKNDTCFDLFELESINLSIDQTDQLVIENFGQTPIITSIEKIIKGQSQVCESIFHPVPKQEISPRRIDKLRKEVEYYCVENKGRQKKNVISKLILGLYKKCDETVFKIEEQEIFEFRKSENGLIINVYQYVIEQDKLRGRIKASFIWNGLEKELIEIGDSNESQNVEIEVCHLLKDCRQNHITVLITMGCWQKQKQTKHEDIEGIITEIKNY